jgi:hypothetical protein
LRRRWPIIVPAVLVVAILAYGLFRESASVPESPAIVLKTSVPVAK